MNVDIMITQHHLETVIKASYYTLNTLTEKTERVWLVFHGYGQLAKFFIKKFECLNAEKNFIIAVQGLSKYYIEGTYGRVGASWMTKENRLMEIQNQYSYIDSVLKQIGDFSFKKFIYFGFSQGTATMGRYAAYAKIPFDQMIVWAGTFPPDTAKKDWEYLTGDEEIHCYTSKDDIYFKDEIVPQQMDTVFKALGKTPELHWYKGGHRVITDIIATL